MAYYSEKEKVYHIYKECEIGKNIDREELIDGTGEKHLCSECQKLKKIEDDKKKERENKKAKKDLREKHKRHDKGVWKKKY